jgi:hypothetical protein
VTSHTAGHWEPFNGSVEIGLRALCVLAAAYPAQHSVQRLTVLDYLVVHSDDVPDGPAGLHPRTPFRGGEILVRRGILQEGLLLYQSRGLVERRFADDGVYYVATDRSAGFLDALDSSYVEDLRERAAWVIDDLGQLDDSALVAFASERIGEWGAEFTMQSVLSDEDEA